MNILKRFLGMLVCIVILGFGVAVILKGAIGAGPYDALTQTVSEITIIKVGTVQMMFNGFFILAQIVLKGRSFNPIQYLQIIVVVVFGYVINFFLYDVLVFDVNHYFIRFMMYLIGTVITAFAVAGIMNIDIVYTALEGFLLTFSETTKTDFVRNRLYFDILAVIISLGLAYIFKVDLLVREGTVMSALIFAPLMGFFIKHTKPMYAKLGILAEEKEEFIKEIEEILEVE